MLGLKLNGFIQENPSHHEPNYDCSKRHMKPTSDVRELLSKKLQVGDSSERDWPSSNVTVGRVEELLIAGWNDVKDTLPDKLRHNDIILEI